MFDPDAYLASKAPRAPDAPLGNGNAVDFDPDAYLAAKAAPAAPREDKGAAHAGLVSGLQGASLGFFDEVAAGLKSLVETKDIRNLPAAYRKNVGEERADLHAAELQHPIASTIGGLAGGLATAAIPGAGLASLGRGFAANAARGAGAGILSGAGASEADSLSGVVQDAAKGGLVGGALGGVVGTGLEKAVEGAGKRIAGRTVSDITGGRATTAGKKVYRQEELVAATAQKFGLDKVATDAAKLQEATRAALEAKGQEIGAAYQSMGGSLGVRTSDIRRAVGSVQADLQGPSAAPLRRALASYKNDLEGAWGGAKRVGIEDLNSEIGKLEATGFAGAELHPVAAKQLKRDLASALEDVLQGRLEEVKATGGRIAGSSLGSREGFSELAGAAEAAQKLPDLNRDYRGLKLIMQSAEDRAALPPSSRAAGGLRNAVGNALDLGLAFTHPVAFGAKKLAEKVVPMAARGADQALNALYQASQRGQVTAQMLRSALEQGVPRAIVERFSTGMAEP